MRVGITAGCWDLLHAGHILFLKECKQNCDKLIVLLQTDPSIDRKEKNRPIESMYERQLKLQSCKYVDEVIIYSTEAELLHILRTLPHNVRFLGADYNGRTDFTGYELYKNDEDSYSPKEIMYLDRGHTYSSTNLRKRIYEAERKINEI